MLNWQEALDKCREKGGDLGSIHSPVEQALVNLNVGKYGLNGELWIGNYFRVLWVIHFFFLIFIKMQIPIFDILTLSRHTTILLKPV